MEYARVPDLALETNTYPRIDVIDVLQKETATAGAPTGPERSIDQLCIKSSMV